MNSKDLVLQIHRDMGKADALDLAKRADGMSGTAIIAEQQKVPLFVPGADYSACPNGAPIGEIVDGELQIFTMITPVNTAHYPGITPNTERSLFSLCHTKDPRRAKLWVAPLGISGLYALDECCMDAGHVWRSTQNDNAFSPSAYPSYWEDLGPVEEVQL